VNLGARRGFIYTQLFLLTTISYVDRAVLSVAAPYIADEFGASPVQMGYLFSSFLWTYVLCLIPVGLMVDRWGARGVAAGGIGLWSLATVVTGAVNSFGAILATRLALGVGESTAYPAGVRVVRESAPVRERGLATAFLNGGSYAGPAVGALLTGWLVATLGWRWSFVIAGLLGFLWLVPWLVWYRPARTGQGSDALPPTPVRGGTLRSLGQLLRRREILAMALTQGCAVYTQYLFLTWLPSYLQAARGLNVQSAGLYTAIPYAASVVLAFAACYTSDRLMKPAAIERGQRRGMVALMLMCSAVVLLAPVVQSTGTITLLFAISLTGISSAISLNFALASDLLHTPGDIGKVTGILVLGGNVFGILAPIVTGYVVEGTGSYSGAFLIAGGLLVVGAASVLMLARPRRAV